MYGQALRLRRICTEDGDFWEAAERLRSDLVNRGYDVNKTCDEINRAAVLDRRSLQTYKEKVSTNRTH